MYKSHLWSGRVLFNYTSDVIEENHLLIEYWVKAAGDLMTFWLEAQSFKKVNQRVGYACKVKKGVCDIHETFLD